MDITRELERRGHSCKVYGRVYISPPLSPTDGDETSISCYLPVTGAAEAVREILPGREITIGATCSPLSYDRG